MSPRLPSAMSRLSDETAAIVSSITRHPSLPSASKKARLSLKPQAYGSVASMMARLKAMTASINDEAESRCCGILRGSGSSPTHKQDRRFSCTARAFSVKEGKDREWSGESLDHSSREKIRRPLESGTGDGQKIFTLHPYGPLKGTVGLSP